MVNPPLSRIDVKSGVQEDSSFGATDSCSMPDGTIYFDHHDGKHVTLLSLVLLLFILLVRSIGLSMFDVNTKLQHDTPIKVDIELSDYEYPCVTQMKFCTTRLNKTVIVMKIQGNFSNHVFQVFNI